MNNEGRLKDALLLIQVVLFSILYSIWILPNTILIRNACLIIGCIIGLNYLIIIRKNILLILKGSNIFIVGLFVWVILHYFLIEKDEAMQLYELKSVWKRSFLCLIFSSTFALALYDSKNRMALKIFEITIFLPSIIYLIKLVSSQYLSKKLNLPDYLLLYYSSSEYYIPKIAYVFFCMPALLFSLMQCYIFIKMDSKEYKKYIFYILYMILIIFIFYNENIKNGIFISGIFIIIFIYKIRSFLFKNYYYIAIQVAAIIILVSIIFKHIDETSAWHTVFSDFSTALNYQQDDSWQLRPNNPFSFPNNGSGNNFNVANYQRLSWFLAGCELLAKNPFGYGLIEGSFGKLAKISWPESNLTQTHSGWLDLTLGLGFIGLFLILAPMCYILINSIEKLNNNRFYFSSYIIALMASYLVIFISNEVSQRVYIECLVFMISFSGIILNKLNENK